MCVFEFLLKVKIFLGGIMALSYMPPLLRLQSPIGGRGAVG